MIPQGTLRVPQGTLRVPQGIFRVPQGTRRYSPLVLGTLAENSGANTSVGTLSISAPGKIVTWSLTDDASGTFVIGGAKSNEVLLGWAQLDYSVTTSYSITARATLSDGVSVTTTTRDFTYLILISPSTTPAQTSNIPLIAADFRHGVSTSGSSITSVAAAWSATGGPLTGVVANQPALTTNGPSGQSYCRVSAGQYFTFTSTGAISAFDYHFVIGPQTLGGTAIILLAKNSNAQSFIQLSHNVTDYDRLTIRDDSAGASTNITLSSPFRVGYIQYGRITFDGTTLTVYRNGTSVGSSAAASGHTWTFSQMFRINALANSAPFYFGACALYTAVQSAGDVTALKAWFEPWRRQRRYVASAGSDSNDTPWLQATPLLTAAFGANGNYLAAGDSPLFSRGDKWVNDQILLASPGTVGNLIIVDAYGTGAAPKFYGCDQYAGTITAVGDGTYTTTIGGAPTFNGMWVQNDTTVYSRIGMTGKPYEFTRMKNQATSNDDSYQYSAGSLTFRCHAGIDPTTVPVYISTGSAATGNTGVQTSQTYTAIRNLDIRFSFQEGFVVGGGTNGYGVNLNCAWNLDDGADNGTLYSSTMFGNGPGLVSSGSGDGYSSHATQASLVWHCWMQNNLLGNVDNLSQANVTVDGCWLEDGGFEFCALNDTAIVGSMIALNNVVVMTDRSTNGNAFEMQAGTGTVLTAYNNTIICKTSSKFGKTGINAAAGGTGHTAKWNIIYGFGLGISAGAAHTLLEDYNNFFANLTDASGAGLTSGGHSFVGDPLFSSLANQDYTLQAGSPSIGTAVGSAQTQDAAGRQRPLLTNPNIGAMEYT